MGTAIYIEITGALLALLYLWLEIRQRNAMWMVGIVSSLFYIYIFYVAKIYADMAMNGYYVLASVYGLWRWHAPRLRRGASPAKPAAGRTPRATALHLLGIAVVLWGAIAFVLVRFTDSPVPYIDAFTTSLSIVAMWMLAQKYIEQWGVWVAVNVVSTGLYCWRGLYPTAALYLIYSVASVIGYFQWRKTMTR